MRFLRIKNKRGGVKRKTQHQGLDFQRGEKQPRKNVKNEKTGRKKRRQQQKQEDLKWFLSYFYMDFISLQIHYIT